MHLQGLQYTLIHPSQQPSTLARLAHPVQAIIEKRFRRIKGHLDEPFGGVHNFIMASSGDKPRSRQRHAPTHRVGKYLLNFYFDVSLSNGFILCSSRHLSSRMVMAL